MLEEQVAVITPIMEEELTTSACHQITLRYRSRVQGHAYVYGSEYEYTIVGTMYSVLSA